MLLNIFCQQYVPKHVLRKPPNLMSVLHMMPSYPNAASTTRGRPHKRNMQPRLGFDKKNAKVDTHSTSGGTAIILVLGLIESIPQRTTASTVRFD